MQSADDTLKSGVIGEREKSAIKIHDYDSDWPKKFEKHTEREMDLTDHKT